MCCQSYAENMTSRADVQNFTLLVYTLSYSRVVQSIDRSVKLSINQLVKTHSHNCSFKAVCYLLLNAFYPHAQSPFSPKNYLASPLTSACRPAGVTVPCDVVSYVISWRATDSATFLWLNSANSMHAVDKRLSCEPVCDEKFTSDTIERKHNTINTKELHTKNVLSSQ